MIHLTLYSRPGCHLCDDMKATIDRLAGSVAFTLDVVDISQNADLETRYGVEIPVLLVDGKKSAKYRVSETDLRRLLIAKAEGKVG